MSIDRDEKSSSSVPPSTKSEDDSDPKNDHEQTAPDPTSLKYEIVNHPLFPFILRAIDDTKGEARPYVPEYEVYEANISPKTPKSLTDTLLGYLHLIQMQEDADSSLHQKARSFCDEILDGMPSPSQIRDSYPLRWQSKPRFRATRSASPALQPATSSAIPSLEPAPALQPATSSAIPILEPTTRFSPTPQPATSSTILSLEPATRFRPEIIPATSSTSQMLQPATRSSPAKLQTTTSAGSGLRSSVSPTLRPSTKAIRKSPISRPTQYEVELLLKLKAQPKKSEK
eukprot:195765_1